MGDELFRIKYLQETFEYAAEAVDSIGTDALPKMLARICENLSAYDSLIIYAFVKDEIPRLLFDDLSEWHQKKKVSQYFEGAYLLDPFYDLYRQRVRDGLYHLASIAPADFIESEYFNTFYKETRLIDEVSIIVNIRPDTQLHLSLGLRDSKRTLTPEDISRLEVVTPLLIALTRSHWPDVSGVTSHVGAHMENAFNQFGSSRLSERESEIARLVLMGHSSKSMARLLNISPETVKVYRKKVHQKLEISSQGELFSIFLEGLKKMPVGQHGDPLNFIR